MGKLCDKCKDNTPDIRDGEDMLCEKCAREEGFYSAVDLSAKLKEAEQKLAILEDRLKFLPDEDTIKFLRIIDEMEDVMYRRGDFTDGDIQFLREKARDGMRESIGRNRGWE
jgi:hypothetical protein